MTPSVTGSISPNVASQLATIDAHAEAVAASTPAGSDLNELAYAIHNLINCIRESTERGESVIGAASIQGYLHSCISPFQGQ